jgi:hypothetical protein
MIYCNFMFLSLNNFKIHSHFFENNFFHQNAKPCFEKLILNRYVRCKKNGLHSFLAFYILQYLGVFWIKHHYTLLHFVLLPQNQCKFAHFGQTKPPFCTLCADNEMLNCRGHGSVQRLSPNVPVTQRPIF